MTKLNWFEARERLERKWAQWKMRVRAKGLSLTVTIPLERTWQESETKTILCFRDKRNGEHDCFFKKPLVKQDVSSLIVLIKKSVPMLPIGKCANCEKKALLRNAHDTISYLHEDLPSKAMMCEKCVQTAIANRDRDNQNLHRKKLKEGFVYVLNAVFESKKNCRQYYFRAFYKTKPSRSAALKEATKNSCKLIPGTLTVHRTIDCFVAD